MESYSCPSCGNALKHEGECTQCRSLVSEIDRLNTIIKQDVPPASDADEKRRRNSALFVLADGILDLLRRHADVDRASVIEDIGALVASFSTFWHKEGKRDGEEMRNSPPVWPTGWGDPDESQK